MREVAPSTSVTLGVTYRDAAGSPVDPPDPLVELTRPDMSVFGIFVPTALGMGRYEQVVAMPAAPLGLWRAEWRGTIDGALRSQPEYFVLGSLPLACEHRWAPSTDLATCSPGSTTGERESAIADASATLWALSGRRFGVCTQVLAANVCHVECACIPRTGGAAWGWPQVRGGCACGEPAITLPAPVEAVLQVSVDGTILPRSGWQLYDGRQLLRCDGDWPCCDELGCCGGVEVTAMLGSPVPGLGRRAAVELACELLAAGTPACRLPARVTTVVRQGITTTIADPQDFFGHGLTGLYLVDLFLTTYNPGARRSVVRIGSVDAGTTRRRS